MRRIILLSVICVLLAVSLPAAAGPLRQRPADGGAPPAAPPADRRTLTILKDGQVLTMSLEEYLPGVIAGEMPASFRPQALRAQAVASRTYALRRMGEPSPRHPSAQLCADGGCCQVWLSEQERRDRWGEDFARYEAAVRSAAEDTAGMILTYGGEPILACFHASSPGRTESSGAVWGTALPYLVSVDTPEGPGDVPGFVSTAELTPEALREGIRSLAPRAPFDGPPEDWVGERVLDTGGRVAAIRIGGTTVPGAAVREVFSLRSACFTLDWTGESFLFTVRGSGHGAGMSQYGAQVLAGQGASWQEILAHYYPGARLESIPS